jgi:parvulin-like peptidyl-prolyl isomerase
VSVENLPKIKGEKAVASVGGDPITLAEFKRALATSHAGAMTAPGRKTETPRPAGQIDYSGIIERLVNIRLIVLEATNMGLNEQPEIRRAVGIFSRDTLIKLMLEQQVKDIRMEDAEVEPIYRERVRESKIRSAVFRKKEDAVRIEAEIQNGTDFGAAVAGAAQKGLAEVETEGGYIKNAELHPSVAQVVSRMEPGDVSPIVTVGLGQHILFQFEGARYPEQIDAETWRRAQEEGLTQKKMQATRDYYEGLRKKVAKIDQALLDSIDYESASPGFEALRDDQRVLVKIKRQDSITVADLTRALDQKFFHGVDKAIAAKRVNAAKADEIERLLHNRILHQAALDKNLDRTKEYGLRIREYEEALIFGWFIEKVITPGIQLNMKELQQYYDDHRDDFTAPKMIRLRSLIFRKKSQAIDAIAKLTGGTDFDWLAANAEGQIDRSIAGVLRFDGRLLTQQGLPEGLRNAVAGGATGDYRLYSDTSLGVHYVLRIEQLVDTGVRPFPEVQREVAEIVFDQKLKAAIDIWTDQLSRHYPVKVFLTAD